MAINELNLTSSSAVCTAVTQWLKIPANCQRNFDFTEIGSTVIGAIKAHLDSFGVARIRILDRPDTIETEVLERLIIGISSNLGFIVPQSHKGNTVSRIQDEGIDYRLHTTRGHQTSAALAFHSDRCDINMLLYVRGARQGGDLSVVSYDAAASRLREIDDRVYTQMFSGFPFDLREERIFPSLKWHWRPILWHTDGGVRGHYIRRFIVDSQRHIDCPRLSREQIYALDLLDQALDSLREQHTFLPVPGELLILNNYRVMHARSDFEDFERESRRLAIRTWVAPFDSEPLPVHLHPMSGACEPGSFRGGVGVGGEFLSRLGTTKTTEICE